MKIVALLPHQSVLIDRIFFFFCVCVADTVFVSMSDLEYPAILKPS